MKETSNTYLECCLYFTANSLARSVTRMADQEFKKLGLSTSHAFLLMIVIEEPGVTQKELAERLNLAQSTVSRFVDSLIIKGLVSKKSSGKIVNVIPTKNAEKKLDSIHGAWKALYSRYSRILGENEGRELTRLNYKAFLKIDSEGE